MAQAYEKRPIERTALVRHGVQVAFLILNVWIGVRFYLWVRFFERSEERRVGKEC